MALLVDRLPTYQETVSLTSVEHALELFDHATEIGMDTETNAKDVRDGSGICYGVSVAAKSSSGIYYTYYFSINHPDQGGRSSNNISKETLYELKRKIENYKGILIFHNAKFDLESLRTVGINYTGLFYCSLQLAHLLNENFPMEKSLGRCAQYYLKDAGKKESQEFLTWKALYGWEGMPSWAIREYAEYDAYLHLALGMHIWALLMKENPALKEYWFEHKMPFINVIRVMERRGIPIDVPRCINMAEFGHSQMEDVKDILGLNPGSRNDLEKLLLGRLKLPVVKRSDKTQAPSFDKEAMEYYEQILENRDNDTARLILTYRGWQKATSSCYEPYVSMLSVDGRLRCNYKLHGTKTGRMSCEKPNLQQIPRSGEKPWNGEMKKCFIAEDGWELWEFDYSQLELRLGTAYANEKALKQVFAEGRDIFTEMSGPLNLVRQDTKTFVYSTQYGAGINRIKNVFGITADKAAQIREDYYNAYPGFRAKSQVAQAKARTNGKLKLWSGRYRHFVNPEKEAHKAFNSVIQGGAADIVERTMLRLFDQVDREDECRMLLQVHDSVVFEIRSDKVAYYTPLIESIMSNVEPDFEVVFAVEGKRFGEK